MYHGTEVRGGYQVRGDGHPGTRWISDSIPNHITPTLLSYGVKSTPFMHVRWLREELVVSTNRAKNIPIGAWRPCTGLSGRLLILYLAPQYARNDAGEKGKAQPLHENASAPTR